MARQELLLPCALDQPTGIQLVLQYSTSAENQMVIYNKRKNYYCRNYTTEPFLLFPEGVKIADGKTITFDIALLTRNRKLRTFWKSSPYIIKAARDKKIEPVDIETYSDSKKRKDKEKSDDTMQYMKRTRQSFPLELIQDGKGWSRPGKKTRWDLVAEMQKLDIFEKLEQRFQEFEAIGGNKKEETGSEDELEGAETEEDGEYSDDGDYNQNIDFDDDDYNMEDDYDDEPAYG